MGYTSRKCSIFSILSISMYNVLPTSKTIPFVFLPPLRKKALYALFCMAYRVLMFLGQFHKKCPQHKI